jgi:hypothetical protein
MRSRPPTRIGKKYGDFRNWLLLVDADYRSLMTPRVVTSTGTLPDVRATMAAICVAPARAGLRRWD